jgi:hypothetical protein
VFLAHTTTPGHIASTGRAAWSNNKKPVTQSVGGSQSMSNGIYKPSTSPPSISVGTIGFSDMQGDESLDGIWIVVGVGIFVLVVGLVIAVLVS